MAAVRRACERMGVEPLRMPSGAAHDTQMMARIAPAGMIFESGARAVGVDVGRLMRRVAWAEQWVEDQGASVDVGHHDKVLQPKPRRNERFSPAETAFAPRKDVLDFDVRLPRPARDGGQTANDRTRRP